MEVYGLWRFNCNLPSQSRWCVMSTYDKSHFHAGPRSLRPWGAAFNFDDSWTWSYLRGVWDKFLGHVTISIINLSHMCAYSAILRLKIINDKSIEAIELSKIPHDIWTRVALSEIIARTDFRRGDVVQRSPISRSYLGYGAYRIYIGEWSDRYGHIYIYIYIFLGRGQEIIGKTLFFLIFFISYSQHCLRMCVPCC